MANKNQPKYNIGDLFILKNDITCVARIIGIYENFPTMGKFSYKIKFTSGQIKIYSRSQIRKITKSYV